MKKLGFSFTLFALVVLMLVIAAKATAGERSRSQTMVRDIYKTTSMKFGSMARSSEFERNCKYKPSAIISELDMAAGSSLTLPALFMGDSRDVGAIDAMGFDPLTPEWHSLQKVDWQWAERLSFLDQICDVRTNKFKDETIAKCVANRGQASQTEFFVVYDVLCSER